MTFAGVADLPMAPVESTWHPPFFVSDWASRAKRQGPERNLLCPVVLLACCSSASAVAISVVIVSCHCFCTPGTFARSVRTKWQLRKGQGSNLPGLHYLFEFGCAGRTCKMPGPEIYLEKAPCLRTWSPRLVCSISGPAVQRLNINILSRRRHELGQLVCPMRMCLSSPFLQKAANKKAVQQQ